MTYSQNHLPLSTVDKRDKRRGFFSPDASLAGGPCKRPDSRLSRLSTVYRGKGVVAWPALGGRPGGVEGTPRGVLPEGAFGGGKTVVLMVFLGGDKAVGGMAWVH